MGCVPNKKLSTGSSAKNSRATEENITNNTPQSNLDNIDGEINDYEVDNVLSASRIPDDIEEQIKMNTYLNSLPINNKQIKNLNESVKKSPTYQLSFDNIMPSNTQLYQKQKITVQTPQKKQNHKFQTKQIFQPQQQNIRFNQKQHFQSIQNKITTTPMDQLSQKQQIKIPQIKTPQPMNQNKILPQYPTQQISVSEPQKSFRMQYQIPIPIVHNNKTQGLAIQGNIASMINQKHPQLHSVQMNTNMPQFINGSIKNTNPIYPQASLLPPMVSSPKARPLNQQMFNQLMKQTNINDQGFGTMHVERMNFGAKVR